MLNTFVIFLARIIGGLVDGATRGNGDNRGTGVGYFFTVMAAQLVLGLFASMIVAWYSRRREFRADEGGADLAGTRSMIGALEALKRVHSPSRLPESMAAFGINGERAKTIQKLFMTHPPLDARIAALETANCSTGSSFLNAICYRSNGAECAHHSALPVSAFHETA